MICFQNLVKHSAISLRFADHHPAFASPAAARHSKADLLSAKPMILCLISNYRQALIPRLPSPTDIATFGLRAPRNLPAHPLHHVQKLTCDQRSPRFYVSRIAPRKHFRKNFGEVTVPARWPAADRWKARPLARPVRPVTNDPAPARPDATGYRSPGDHPLRRSGRHANSRPWYRHARCAS